MSTQPAADTEVAVVGAGVVGCAAALTLARRGVAVTLLEAEPEPALAASATNSGVLHTGFDSAPGELETKLILRSARLRPPVLQALGVPVLNCGARVQPRDSGEQAAVEGLAANAARNGVSVEMEDDGSLTIPGEAVTDPVAFTVQLASSAQRHGAALLTEQRIVGIERMSAGLRLTTASGDRLMAHVLVNCAGLFADEVARLAGDDSFAIYPRKGEFLVFAPPDDQPLEQILLPIPSKRTKGVLVFPTIDGMIVAGPTAVDLEDKLDWSVRSEAQAELLPQAARMYPPLADAEPVFAYAGLRPAGRGVNYVIGPSHACLGLVNVAAIRSTGLTASLGIAERVAGIVAALGVKLGPERELEPLATSQDPAVPWWRRAAEYRALKAA
jgi:glycerol-3-phosphate dehydrogenase